MHHSSRSNHVQCSIRSAYTLGMCSGWGWDHLVSIYTVMEFIKKIEDCYIMSSVGNHVIANWTLILTKNLIVIILLDCICLMLAGKTFHFPSLLFHWWWWPAWDSGPGHEPGCHPVPPQEIVCWNPLGGVWQGAREYPSHEVTGGRGGPTKETGAHLKWCGGGGLFVYTCVLQIIFVREGEVGG